MVINGDKMKLWERISDTFNLIVGVLRSQAGDPNAWEPAIAAFEARDRRAPPPTGAVVFTGSSSINLWSTLERDMAPLRVLNRGFGGSKIDEVARYADRIVTPYRPWATVLFAGTNDIAGSKPAAAEAVFAGYCAFVEKVWASLPDLQIYYVGITPTRARWELWPLACDANRMIQAQTSTDPRLHFIDLTGQFLGPDGRPDRRLYRMDGLHPNARGYERWTAVIKPILEEAARNRS